MYDVNVCCGGIQGLWTANVLAEKKKKVLLLEQEAHGLSRITRYSYSDPHHAQLMPEAFQRWDALEKRSKLELFV
ncbi:unnamed protein product [Clavelina lepadiformis]|uniref:Uncharacterized protein n=1 Tax=Clavelina lepadiformis TaxID=159417 RepID=A0ABP0GVW4_CLALP